MDLSAMKLLLVEFAAADLENDLRCGGSDGGRGCGRGDVVRGQEKHGLIIGEGDRDGVDLRARNFDFFGLAGLGVFYGLFGGLRRRGLGWRLRPNRR